MNVTVLCAPAYLWLLDSISRAMDNRYKDYLLFLVKIVKVKLYTRVVNLFSKGPDNKNLVYVSHEISVT
jgi:hypothetical protein